MRADAGAAIDCGARDVRHANGVATIAQEPDVRSCNAAPFKRNARVAPEAGRGTDLPIVCNRRIGIVYPAFLVGFKVPPNIVSLWYYKHN